MTKATQTTTSQSETSAPSPAFANSAVARCMDAWTRAYNKEKAKGSIDYAASRKAEKAYHDLMPPLAGYENIRDFIACVANAMLIGAISDDQGTKLLYAAQVALSTLRRQPSAPKAAV